MLNLDPERRATAAEVLASPWLEDADLTLSIPFEANYSSDEEEEEKPDRNSSNKKAAGSDEEDDVDEEDEDEDDWRTPHPQFL